MSDNALVITREFRAPLSLVWAALSEEDRLSQWWGPKGFIWLSSKLDFRPGGFFLYGMQAPADMGSGEMWGRFDYDEIVPQERIVFRSGFADSEGNILRPPFSNLFPMQIENVWTLEEMGSNTRLTLRGTPYNASQEEIDFFIGMRSNMQQGFAGTFEQLEAYLAKSSV